MKKILLIIGAGVLLISCKKEYACSCSTTLFLPDNSGQLYYTSETVKMTAKMTKDQARAVCANEEDNLNATYSEVYGPSNGSPSQTSATSICNLN